MANCGDGNNIQYTQDLDPSAKLATVLGSTIIAEYSSIILFRHLFAA